MTLHQVSRRAAGAGNRIALVGFAGLGVVVQPGLAVAFVPVAALAAMFTHSLAKLSARTGDCSRTAMHIASVIALKFYSFVLCVTGLVAATGLAAPSILISVVLGRTALWLAHGQNTHGWLTVGVHPAGEPIPSALPLDTATGTQLRGRWRTTYLQLGQAPDQIVRARVIAARQELLSEFHRRDPDGFAKFLRSADPAKRYPARFFRDRTVARTDRLTHKQ